MLLLAMCFGSCILASVRLEDRISTEYRQPVMALCCVPFLTLHVILQSPATSRMSLLGLSLFGLHAILIVAGVPIVFTGQWESLNILVPVFGYGRLSGVVVHLYSRFALSRLKKLTHRNDSEHAPNEGHEVDG